MKYRNNESDNETCRFIKLNRCGFRHALWLWLLINTVACGSCQKKPPHPSVLEYPVGYPTQEASALQQLKSYPMPRYLPDNHLLRLFNWMDPGYLSSKGQPGVSLREIVKNDYLIQQELALHWHYGIVIPNSGCAFDGIPPNTTPPAIKLANAYPAISLDVITFWGELSPRVLGYKNARPMISDAKTDAPYCISFTRDGQKRSEIKFNFPDSLIRIDGGVQKYYLKGILKYLHRPINRINENGEVEPGPYMFKYIQHDPEMMHMKDSMKINSWKDFASTRKLQMRNVYSSAFMKGLPQLKNTFFSFYTVEGGPIDRFTWHIMKKCMTPVNGIYYSTPDFYPRWPHNWKYWQGAWHGWQWIEIGRKTEIKDGDYLFSPFIAAGWSKNNEDNITPGQWLGLLKCLSVVGAEFYYVGYFNLSAPFNKPSTYIWQAAIPAYAQAITSRFENVLKNGNVLFNKNGQPILSYPTDDEHTLITARKENGKEKYVICGTYQPFSNDSDEIPEARNVNVTINGHTLSFEIRRQGSVYIYEKTPDNRTLFYQLDKWQQDAHPDHWSKDFYFEAEVADSGITSADIYTTHTGNEGDYRHFTSYVSLTLNKACLYHFWVRDSANKNRVLWIKCKGTGTLSVSLSNDSRYISKQEKSIEDMTTWKWIEVTFSQTYTFSGNNALKFTCVKGNICIDKFVITAKKNRPTLYK